MEIYKHNCVYNINNSFLLSFFYIRKGKKEFIDEVDFYVNFDFFCIDDVRKWKVKINEIWFDDEYNDVEEIHLCNVDCIRLEDIVSIRELEDLCLSLLKDPVYYFVYNRIGNRYCNIEDWIYNIVYRGNYIVSCEEIV